MKKLTALLLSCLMMTAAFVSCGEDDDDEGGSKSSKKKNSSISSEIDDEDGNDDKVIDNDNKPTDDAGTDTTDTSIESVTKDVPEEKTEAPDTDDTSAFLGKWESFQLKVDESVIGETLDPSIRTRLQLEIFDDGTGVAAGIDNEDEEELTWKSAGKGKIDVTDTDGDTVTFSCEDGKLTTEIEEDGQKIGIVLEKVKRFTKPSEVTTEPPTEEKTENTTKKPDADDAASKFIGTWECDNENIELFTFKDNGKATLSITGKDVIAMDGDKCLFGGQDFTEYLKYDGKTLSLNAEGMDVLTMEKLSGSDKEYDGEYALKSGIMYDTFNSPGNNLYGVDLTITLEGSKTYINMVDVMDYSVSGDKIKFSNLPESLTSGVSLHEETYEFSGDTLTLKNGAGTDVVLTRKK